jgi:hypothetical protein
MVQAVCHWPVTIETQVFTQVSACGIYGGQSGTGTGLFFGVPQFSPASIISLWLSILIYHLGDKQ